MKIYTKTGDKGTTGIIGQRISKASLIIDTIGTIDELNAILGIVVTKISTNLETQDSKGIDLNSTQGLIIEVQNALFDIGAILANSPSERDFLELTSNIEKTIDQMENQLPKLQNFILPGGSEISVNLHLARSICRRAERLLVKAIEENSEVISSKESFNILALINRLSDYLFVLARFINYRLGYEEIIWSKKQTKSI